MPSDVERVFRIAQTSAVTSSLSAIPRIPNLKAILIFLDIINLYRYESKGSQHTYEIAFDYQWRISIILTVFCM